MEHDAWFRCHTSCNHPQPQSAANVGYPAKILVSISSCIIKGNLEVKLPPTVLWTDRKAEVGMSEKRRAEERRSEKRKSEKKEDAGARKGRKVAKH